MYVYRVHKNIHGSYSLQFAHSSSLAAPNSWLHRANGESSPRKFGAPSSCAYYTHWVYNVAEPTTSQIKRHQPTINKRFQARKWTSNFKTRQRTMAESTTAAVTTTVTCTCGKQRNSYHRASLVDLLSIYLPLAENCSCGSDCKCVGQQCAEGCCTCVCRGVRRELL